MIFKIFLPLKVTGQCVGYNKIRYKNKHEQSSIKKDYQLMLYPDLFTVPKNLGVISIKYKFWEGKKDCDLMNWIIFPDKCFQDAIVQHRIIKDDKCKFVKSVSCEYMGKSNEKTLLVEVYKWTN